jgi:hypothetical protein
MPEITPIRLEHALSPEEAKRRIDSLLPEAQKQHSGKVSDVKQSWDGFTNRFSFRAAKTFNVEGALTVREGEVVLTGKLPSIALRYLPEIERILREEAGKILG